MPGTLEISRDACVIPSPEQDPAQPATMQALAPPGCGVHGQGSGPAGLEKKGICNLVFSVVGYRLYKGGEGAPGAASFFSAELWDRGNSWRWAVPTDAGLWGQDTEARAHMARAHLCSGNHRNTGLSPHHLSKLPKPHVYPETVMVLSPLTTLS